VRIVPLTADLWTGPLPKSLRGVAVLEGDRLWCTAGVYLGNRCWIMCLQWKDRPERFSFHQKRVLLNGFRMIMDMIKDSQLPIQTLADDCIERSESFLTHLGFIPVSGRVYQWLR